MDEEVKFFAISKQDSYTQKFPFSPHFPLIIIHWSCVGFFSRRNLALLFLVAILSIFFVILEEEVVAGDSEGAHKDDELCEVHLAVVV